VALPPGAEYRILFYVAMPCAATATSCRFGVAPSWHIVLSGRESAGMEFSTPIDVLLPIDAGQPVVVPPRLTVTRVSAVTAGDSGRIAARFTNNVILVPVSVAGQDLWLLFDTGAQLSMLRPDAARRLGLSINPGAPVVPTVGLGGRVNASLAESPPLRIGDYVIEHLAVGVAELPDFPLAIDGVIGGNFVEAFRITIDHRAKDVRLEPAR